MDIFLPHNNNLSKWDLRFLDMARMVSTWSKDPSTKCGAVITDQYRRVVSVGYNGFPSLMNDSPELYANREEKYSRTVHCEVNALNAARMDVHNYTLYTWPCISCDRCFVQMAEAGLKRFVAPTPTADMTSRWGAAFEKVRGYLREINDKRKLLGMPLLELVEYPGLHT